MSANVSLLERQHVKRIVRHAVQNGLKYVKEVDKQAKQDSTPVACLSTDSLLRSTTTHL